MEPSARQLLGAVGLGERCYLYLCPKCNLYINPYPPNPAGGIMPPDPVLRTRGRTNRREHGRVKGGRISVVDFHCVKIPDRTRRPASMNE